MPLASHRCRFAPQNLPLSGAECTERVYINVDAFFDSTGYMQPRNIFWKDGRTFKIDRVKDFCPAGKLEISHTGDCYTVIIKGKERHLFFERTNPLTPSRFGRWFVERKIKS